MGGETRETFYPETQQIVRANMFGNKSSQKIAKCFLFKHEYRDQKMVEKNAGNNYSRNTPIMPTKKWKKIVAKYCEKTFFKYTRIS